MLSLFKKYQLGIFSLVVLVASVLLSACSSAEALPAPTEIDPTSALEDTAAVEDNATESAAREERPEDGRRGGRDEMINAAAAELGIAAEDLSFAIGNTPEINFEAAAELLGIPAADIELALQNNRPERGQNGEFPPPFLAAIDGAAAELEVSVEDLTAALGSGFPLDWDAAATTLGISTEALQTAFQNNGFQGQGQGPREGGGGDRTAVFEAIAEDLGVTVEAVTEAAGQGRPDFAAIAEALDLPVEDVQAAWENNRPQGGGNGNRGGGNGGGGG